MDSKRILGKHHNPEWWADKAARGTAPARCAHVWEEQGRCRAEALYDVSCGRSHGYKPLGMVS